MKDLLDFILKNLLGKSKFSISETQEDNRLNLVVKAPQDKVGLIIGKGGKTIKAIRNLLRVRATLDKVYFNLEVESSS